VWPQDSRLCSSAPSSHLRLEGRLFKIFLLQTQVGLQILLQPSSTNVVFRAAWWVRFPSACGNITHVPCTCAAHHPERRQMEGSACLAMRFATPCLKTDLLFVARSSVVGTVYPVYASLKAIEAPLEEHPRRDAQWCAGQKYQRPKSPIKGAMLVVDPLYPCDGRSHEARALSVHERGAYLHASIPAFTAAFVCRCLCEQVWCVGCSTGRSTVASRCWSNMRPSSSPGELICALSDRCHGAECHKLALTRPL